MTSILTTHTIEINYENQIKLFVDVVDASCSWHLRWLIRSDNNGRYDLGWVILSYFTFIFMTKKIIRKKDEEIDNVD